MIFFRKKQNERFSSSLYNENTFYQAFLNDLSSCQQNLIIESPFISSSRMATLIPVFKRLIQKGTQIYIITRDPIELEENFRHYATEEILHCSELGVNVLLQRGYHHRKLAIIDQKVLYEYSFAVL